MESRSRWSQYPEWSRISRSPLKRGNMILGPGWPEPEDYGGSGYVAATATDAVSSQEKSRGLPNPYLICPMPDGGILPRRGGVYPVSGAALLDPPGDTLPEVSVLATRKPRL